MIVPSCLLPGARDSITKYLLQSQAAETRANATTMDVGSEVLTSAALRELTETKLNQTREMFMKRHTEHAQRLDDLAGELQSLDLSEINHKVKDLSFMFMSVISNNCNICLKCKFWHVLKFFFFKC